MSLLLESVMPKINQNPNYTGYSYFTIRSGKLVVVHANCNDYQGRRMSEKSIKNLEKKGTVLHIKQGTSSRLECMLSTWCKCLMFAWNKGLHDLNGLKRKPVFVTLTLPSLQVHSDQVIKRECLMRFISELQRNHNIVNYFWKAEVQKNGNIHFHLIIDRYLDKHTLHVLWNRHLERLGYVSAFEEKFKHRNPPSSHVEKVETVSEIVSYVTKYVTKDLEGRNIDGRKWGRSKELENFMPCKYLASGYIYDYIGYLIDNEKAIVYSDEFYSIVRFTKKFNYDVDYKPFADLENPHLNKLYYANYQECEQVSPLIYAPVAQRVEKPKQLQLFDEWTYRKPPEID